MTNIELSYISSLPYDERVEKLRKMCLIRAEDGATPVGYFQVLQPDFIDYKKDGYSFNEGRVV